MLASWVWIGVMGVMAFIYAADLFNVAPFFRTRTPWAGHQPEIWAVVTLGLMVPVLLMAYTSSDPSCASMLQPTLPAWVFQIEVSPSSHICTVLFSRSFKAAFLLAVLIVSQFLFRPLGDLRPKIIRRRNRYKDIDGGYSFEPPNGWRLVPLSLWPVEFSQLRIAMQPQEGNRLTPFIGVNIFGQNNRPDPFIPRTWKLIKQKDRMIGKAIRAVEMRHDATYNLLTIWVLVSRSGYEILFHLTYDRGNRGEEQCEAAFETFLSTVKLRLPDNSGGATIGNRDTNGTSSSEVPTLNTVLRLGRWRKRFDNVAGVMLAATLSTLGAWAIVFVFFLFRQARWLESILHVMGSLFNAELATLVLFGGLVWIIGRAARRHEIRFAEEIRQRGTCTSRSEYFWIFSGACQNCGGRTWLHYRWLNGPTPVFAKVCARCRKGDLNEETMRNVRGEWFPLPGRWRSEDFTHYQIPVNATLDQKRVQAKHFDTAEFERIPESIPTTEAS